MTSGSKISPRALQLLKDYTFAGPCGASVEKRWEDELRWHWEGERMWSGFSSHLSDQLQHIYFGGTIVFKWYPKGIAELGKKAKNNQISIEDMDGGTFTIR